MNGSSADGRLSILELPTLIKALFERAQRPLLPGAVEPVGFFVRYLRRKPGHGLAVIYHVDETGHGRSRPQANIPSHSISLTLDEASLEGSQICFSIAQTQQALLEVGPSGWLSLRDVGLSVQVFPADTSLPALAASCDTRQDSPIFAALAAAAQRQLGNPSWQLLSALAEPVRYKPGSRCVIRYHLALECAEGEASHSRSLILFGKVYANPEQARTLYELQHQLFAEQGGDGAASPILPRPMGIVEPLGLTLHQAVQSSRGHEERLAGEGEPLPTGTQVLRPQILRGRGGQVSEVIIPQAVLGATAKALARLHQSKVSPNANMLRTGAKEAKRISERASIIARYYPAQTAEALRLGQQLAERLERAHPDMYWPGHGGFKPSQLLIDRDQVFIVDFDGLCLADPALDVGYFLAYLRPSGLWQQRPGMRQWFEEAAALFIQSYQQALLEQGLDSSAMNGIRERSSLFEAALLFKIATRRVHRLNSPRPQEVSAMLREIAACLSRE